MNSRDAKEKDIYKITNRINGKVYIGQSVDYEKRFHGHKTSAERGDEAYLYNAMRKYGVDNFDCELIGKFENYDEMCEKYSCTKRIIRDINKGKRWYSEDLEYPLNKNIK